MENAGKATVVSRSFGTFYIPENMLDSEGSDLPALLLVGRSRKRAVAVLYCPDAT